MAYVKESGQEAQQGTGQVIRNHVWASEKSLLSLQAGQLQTNRVQATVAPLPMTPTSGRDPKLPAASKPSSEAFFWPAREGEVEEQEEEE